MSRLGRWLVVAWLLLVNAAAGAHSGGASYVELERQAATTSMRFDLPLAEIASEQGLDVDADGALRWREVLAGAPAVQAALRRRMQLRESGRDCSWRFDAAPHLVRRDTGLHLRLEAVTDCAANSERAAPRLDAATWLREIPDHGVYVTEATRPGWLALLAGSSTALNLQESPSVASGAATATDAVAFLRLGVEHMLTGYDHLAFLALLLLGIARSGGPGRAPRDFAIDAIRVVTAFTLAHSQTLLLATWGWLRVPAGPVEAGIAASIVVTALALLAGVRAALGWPAAFAFGLLHGLGFAGMLAELLQGVAIATPLFAFNLGLELAQLLVVACMAPLLWCAARRAWWTRAVAPGLACVLGLLGASWLWERL